jgi:hypothetical protein
MLAKNKFILIVFLFFISPNIFADNNRKSQPVAPLKAVGVINPTSSFTTKLKTK